MTPKDELTANAGWPQWATAGTKVICIERRENKLFFYDGPFPEVGREYTIKDPCIAPSGDLCISVVELRWRDVDPGWPLACFRPAIAAKTEAEDVALVKSLLSIGNEELAEHTLGNVRLDIMAEMLNEAWLALGEGE